MFQSMDYKHIHKYKCVRTRQTVNENSRLGLHNISLANE